MAVATEKNVVYPESCDNPTVLSFRICERFAHQSFVCASFIKVFLHQTFAL